MARCYSLVSCAGVYCCRLQIGYDEAVLDWIHIIHTCMCFVDISAYSYNASIHCPVVLPYGLSPLQKRFYLLFVYNLWFSFRSLCTQ